MGAAGCSGDSEYWHRVLSRGGCAATSPRRSPSTATGAISPASPAEIFAYMRGHAAALLVQYERTGNRGNLRRALATMPAWYARRCLGRALRGRSERDLLLPHEVRGFASGLLFYLRAPRPPPPAGDR